MSKYSALLEPIRSAFNPLIPVHWADLGCGSGIFTEVLAEILPHNSHISAVDYKIQHLPGEMSNKVQVTFHHNDFVNDNLNFTKLDGILMANSFHFVKSKASLIQKLEQYFTDNPKFIMVEYEHTVPNMWEPYPIPFAEMKELFRQLSYRKIEKTGEQHSVYGGSMYACLISKY